MSDNWRDYRELSYAILVERDPETRHFVVSYPDLKGVFGIGKTLDEAEKSAEKNRKLWTTTRLEKGLFVPKPVDPNEKTVLTLRVPRSLHLQLKTRSQMEGTSLNRWAISLLSRDF